MWTLSASILSLVNEARRFEIFQVKSSKCFLFMNRFVCARAWFRFSCSVFFNLHRKCHSLSLAHVVAPCVDQSANRIVVVRSWEELFCLFELINIVRPLVVHNLDNCWFVQVCVEFRDVITFNSPGLLLLFESRCCVQWIYTRMRLPANITLSSAMKRLSKVSGGIPGTFSNPVSLNFIIFGRGNSELDRLLI